MRVRGSVRVRVRVRVAAGLTEPTWLSPWLQSAEDRTYVHAHVMCVGPCRPLEVPPPWRGEAPPPAAAGTTAGCFEKGVGWTDFFSAVSVVERKKVSTPLPCIFGSLRVTCHRTAFAKKSQARPPYPCCSHKR